MNNRSIDSPSRSPPAWRRQVAVAAESRPRRTRAAWACTKCPFAQGYQVGRRTRRRLPRRFVARSSATTPASTRRAVRRRECRGRLHARVGLPALATSCATSASTRAHAASTAASRAPTTSACSTTACRVSISDTAETTVSGTSAAANLTLPSGWVTGGSTAGMTALDDEPARRGRRLRSRPLRRERPVLLGPERRASALDYKRDERSGTRPSSAPSAASRRSCCARSTTRPTASTPTVRYQGERWFAQVGYYASIYNNNASSLRLDNPFNAFVAGRRRRAAWRWSRTTTTGDRALRGLARAAVEHDGRALGGDRRGHAGRPSSCRTPSTRHRDRRRCRSSNLDGNVGRDARRPHRQPRGRWTGCGCAARSPTTSARTTAAGGPSPRSSTPTCSRSSEDRVNPVYGYERMRARTAVRTSTSIDDLTVGVGGEYRTLDRTGTTQEVSKRGTARRLGPRAVPAERLPRYRPEGGARSAIRTATTERGAGERPEPADAQVQHGVPVSILRRAARQRRGRTLPLSVSANAFYGDDSYTKSQIGLGPA